MRHQFYSLLGTCLLLLSSAASGDEWGQFRGPDAGVVERSTVPLHWKESEGIRWKTTIPGKGHSSPVHNGHVIWVTTASEDGRRLGAVAVNAESGRLTHEVTLFEPGQVEEIHADNSHASPSPILQNGLVFAHFGTNGTACLNAETAEILWRNNDYHIKHDGGPGSSPILFQDRLILTYDGADAQYVVALDSATGKEVWKRERSAPLRENPITHRAFATPLLVQFKDQWQLISPGADQCHAYDPATGNEIWHIRYVGFSNVPCPVADAGHVYLCTGFFKPDLLAVALGGAGDVTESHITWRVGGPIPDTPSPLLYQGRIYTVTNQGIVACHDAKTGKRNWVKRVGGNYSASPMAIAGQIFFCSEEGVTHIIDPTIDPPELITNKVNGAIKATPALLGDDLLLRTDTDLYRINGTAE